MNVLLKSLRMFVLLALLIVPLAACTTSTSNEGDQVVNLYTTRHYESDDLLFDLFEEKTGIKVNVVSEEANNLIERIATEGESTQADLLFTADAGTLNKATERGLFQPVASSTVEANIPASLRDKKNHWVGLTKRARVIVYSLDRVKPEQLSTYEDLASAKWKDRLVVRTSTQIYNQSLLASLIEVYGKDRATKWAQGIVSNMKRDPQGNDRAQATAVASGEADVTIMNTYYLGLMMNSADKAEQEVAKKVGVFFPDQATTGTHVNISGIGITKHAKHTANAQKLIEFLTTEQAQRIFSDASFEYPANPAVKPSNWLQSLGEFKEQNIEMSVLGTNNAEAVRIFTESGWK